MTNRSAPPIPRSGWKKTMLLLLEVMTSSEIPNDDGGCLLVLAITNDRDKNPAPRLSRCSLEAAAFRMIGVIQHSIEALLVSSQLGGSGRNISN